MKTKAMVLVALIISILGTIAMFFWAILPYQSEAQEVLTTLGIVILLAFFFFFVFGGLILILWLAEREAKINHMLDDYYGKPKDEK